MDAPRNSFCEHPLRGLPAYLASGRIAASRARSLLAYLCDMSRRSLRGSLRFIPQNEFLGASS